MKISDYVQALEAIKAEHGDIKMDANGYSGRHEAYKPTVAYRKILGKRESRPEFWNGLERDAEKRGEKVVRIA